MYTSFLLNPVKLSSTQPTLSYYIDAKRSVKRDSDHDEKITFVLLKRSLSYPTLARLRDVANRRVTHCHHSILCRPFREALATNQRHYQDSTVNVILFNLSV